MPLDLFYTMVQKSQKWPKTQIKGGSCLKVMQPFQKYAKTFHFRQAFRQKNRLKIALQVSKLGFSPIVMP